MVEGFVTFTNASSSSSSHSGKDQEALKVLYSIAAFNKRPMPSLTMKDFEHLDSQKYEAIPIPKTGWIHKADHLKGLFKNRAIGITTGLLALAFMSDFWVRPFFRPISRTTLAKQIFSCLSSLARPGYLTFQAFSIAGQFLPLVLAKKGGASHVSRQMTYIVCDLFTSLNPPYSPIKEKQLLITSMPIPFLQLTELAVHRILSRYFGPGDHWNLFLHNTKHTHTHNHNSITLSSMLVGFLQHSLQRWWLIFQPLEENGAWCFQQLGWASHFVYMQSFKTLPLRSLSMPWNISVSIKFLLSISPLLQRKEAISKNADLLFLFFF